ncbi:HEPN domain-containing protein [Sphingomonas sp. Leaf230]|uniref:HEPN domain-containing protein n=1 Tax=Sphingomonas sp. Leaf230 TaxID=1735694 RepID=UPI000A5B10E8|nr:HEPN domain-containing protein [Sphingomonas sp. Leaf230]
MPIPNERLVAVLRQQALAAKVEVDTNPENTSPNWAALTKRTIRTLVEALRDLKELAALEGSWGQLPYQLFKISLDNVAFSLLVRAQSIPAEQIVVDLERFLKDKVLSLAEVRLVVGIKLEGIIDLGDGFSIVAPHFAPYTEFSEFLFSSNNKPKHGWGEPPTAALVRRSQMNFRIDPPSDDAPQMTTQPPTSEADWQAALSSCALASDSAPQFRQMYMTIEDAGWIDRSYSGFSAAYSFPVPETPASFFKEYRVADLFQKVRRGDKVLNLAISHLINSRRRLSREERAIDLGTCLEILLMSGSKDNSEISYKIATRTAWLVGKGPKDRLRCYNAARALYADRSMAAHTGSLKLPRNMDEMNVLNDRLIASDRLCVEVISHLLDRGGAETDNWVAIVLDLPAEEHAQ